MVGEGSEDGCSACSADGWEVGRRAHERGVGVGGVGSADGGVDGTWAERGSVSVNTCDEPVTKCALTADVTSNTKDKDVLGHWCQC